jgi:hypothetical protein
VNTSADNLSGLEGDPPEWTMHIGNPLHVTSATHHDPMPVMQRGVAAEGVTYRGAIGCSCKGQIPDQIAGYIVKR